MVTTIAEFIAESRKKGGGWSKLLQFMQQYPYVFPEVRQGANGTYSLALYEFLGDDDIDLDTYSDWSSITARGLRSMAPGEDAKEWERQLHTLLYSTAIEIERDEAAFNAVGLGYLLLHSDWLVRTDDQLRFLPFGVDFGKNTWSATANMMPTIGAGMEVTARQSKAGWIYKKVNYPGESIRTYDAMAKYPDYFAAVKQYDPKEGSYWQEPVDVVRWAEFVRTHPNEAHTLFLQLRDNIIKATGIDKPDLAISHNVGYVADGTLKAFDV